MMKLTINMEEEKELREHVKKLIEGQVKAIMREELRDIIKNSIKEQIPQITLEEVENVIKKQVQSDLKSRGFAGGFNRENAVKAIAREEIKAIITKTFENIKIVDLI